MKKPKLFSTTYSVYVDSLHNYVRAVLFFYKTTQKIQSELVILSCYHGLAPNNCYEKSCIFILFGFNCIHVGYIVVFVWASVCVKKRHGICVKSDIGHWYLMCAYIIKDIINGCRFNDSILNVENFLSICTQLI